MNTQFGGALTNLLKDIFVSKSLTLTDNAKSNVSKTDNKKTDVKQTTNTINEHVPVYQIAKDEPHKIKKIYRKVPKRHVTKIADDLKEYKLAYDVDYNAMVPIDLKK